MSNSHGKFIIGITGNIATGKSVVRRMLEHLGAYTIDADALAHRTYAKGAPGYQPVIDKFGKWLLNKDGEVDRAKLGNLVFTDPEAMNQLESIVHPLVLQATEVLIQRAPQKVVGIEAIKLLETDLRKMCDSIWVTNAPEEVQIKRLVEKRGFTRDRASERLHTQSAQSAKVALANIIVTNTGSFDDLWNQVSAAWKQIVPGASTETTQVEIRIPKPAAPAAPATPPTTPAAAPTAAAPAPSTPTPAAAAPAATPVTGAGELTVKRGKPKQSAAIAELITRLSKGTRKMSADDVMASFGDKAYMLLQLDDKLVGLAGWQVENLVTRTTDIFLEDAINPQKALELLIKEVERASNDLQSEASLIFPSGDLAKLDSLWKQIGYEKRTPETLGVQAWQDSATEALTAGGVLLFKQLRQDRVLRPI